MLFKNNFPCCFTCDNYVRDRKGFHCQLNNLTTLPIMVCEQHQDLTEHDLKILERK